MMWCGILMLWVSVCSQKLDSEGVKAISGKQNICHTLEHAAVCRLRDGVDVWRHFMPFLPSVHLNDVLRINGQVLVGVNYHTEETRVCLKYKQKKTNIGNYKQNQHNLNKFTENGCDVLYALASFFIVYVNLKVHTVLQSRQSLKNTIH